MKSTALVREIAPADVGANVDLLEISPADTLLTQEQTRRLLRLKNVGTLAVWRSKKRYPLNYVRVGVKIFYTLADVQDFIKRRTVVVAERV